LVFYETRSDWTSHHPDELNWIPATSRQGDLGGHYVARIAGTTASGDGGKIVQGFNQTSSKGAGIRLYEYSSPSMIADCRVQLEAIYWLCLDSDVVAEKNGMTVDQIRSRKNHTLSTAHEKGLLDYSRLQASRIINSSRRTVCPLCMEELSGNGFFSRMAQAEGREVLDLTITQINLFHIRELKFGEFNHRPYNLGWGHHHCNVVVKDSGVIETLQWMHDILQRNMNDGHFSPNTSSL
jgi:hypothetical protein